jgi:sarcosine oxidase gamma subunit
MEFDTEWKTLGKHRVRLHASRGFPTETLHTVADVARLAIENNMSARARLVEVIYRDQDKAYEIFVGTTVPDDRRCAAQLELAMATVLGLLPEQITITVNQVEQREVDLNFGVYERLLSQKLGSVSPIQ